MKCFKCGREDSGVFTLIKGEWHCNNCSVKSIHNKYRKLKKRYTKLNRQYKSLLNSNKEG